MYFYLIFSFFKLLSEDFFVILSAILLPIKSPVASAVFLIAFSEAVFTASVVVVVALSRRF